MGVWKRKKIYIKVLNNSFDESSRIDEVQDKPFGENHENINVDNTWYAESEYELEVENDISREEAEFIEGFYSDYEDFDTIDYVDIDLSDYEMSKDDVNEYYEDDEDDEYDEKIIYLNGDESIYGKITLKDVVEYIDISQYTDKMVYIIRE